MGPTIDIGVYSDALVVLATAGVVVPMVHRWGMSPVLGYLGAGMLLGPLGLGTFKDVIPSLYWFTIVEAKNVSGIADLGVVFLMFLIGLELSFERLHAMRRLVLGLGGSQVLVTSIALAATINALGQPLPAAITLGSLLALSSTAIVIEVLTKQKRMATSAGRASFSVLLAQDLAVVPILLMVTALSGAADGSVLSAMGFAAASAIAAVAIIAVVGRLMLRPLFRLVAATQENELFIAAILFVVVAASFVAALAGISMALGAFVAGLLLAETEYRKAIEATIEPFKGLLLGIFFFTVGMGIDVRELLRAPGLLVAAVAGLIALKAIILLGLARLYRLSWPATIESSLLLAPGGEFAFVGIAAATSSALIGPTVASFTLAAVAISMVLIPGLSLLARRLSRQFTKPAAQQPELLLAPRADAGQAIVVGHGRVGRVVCDMLDARSVRYIAVENNPASVVESRRQGREVYYGDFSNTAFLNHCGLREAAAVIITIHTQQVIDRIVELVREVRPDVAIIARARDAAHARHLYAVGVTDAVPETIEASLQLSEAALIALGQPAGPVIAAIHEKRDAFRAELLAAAGTAGLSETRSVRAKTLRR